MTTVCMGCDTRSVYISVSWEDTIQNRIARRQPEVRRVESEVVADCGCS